MASVSFLDFDSFSVGGHSWQPGLCPKLAINDFDSSVRGKIEASHSKSFLMKTMACAVVWPIIVLVIRSFHVFLNDRAVHALELSREWRPICL